MRVGVGVGVGVLARSFLAGLSQGARGQGQRLVMWRGGVAGLGRVLVGGRGGGQRCRWLGG